AISRVWKTSRRSTRLCANSSLPFRPTRDQPGPFESSPYWHVGCFTSAILTRNWVPSDARQLPTEECYAPASARLPDHRLDRFAVQLRGHRRLFVHGGQGPVLPVPDSGRDRLYCRCIPRPSARLIGTHAEETWSRAIAARPAAFPRRRTRTRLVIRRNPLRYVRGRRAKLNPLECRISIRGIAYRS